MRQISLVKNRTKKSTDISESAVSQSFIYPFIF